MECYSAIKKEQNTAICKSMDATRGDHTKWSKQKDKLHKSERERQIPHHFYVESKVWYKWTNYETEAESQT